jgi:hypothetical protein
MANQQFNIKDAKNSNIGNIGGSNTTNITSQSGGVVNQTLGSISSKWSPADSIGVCRHFKRRLKKDSDSWTWCGSCKKRKKKVTLVYCFDCNKSLCPICRKVF